jgi:hypothetical protein
MALSAKRNTILNFGYRNDKKIRGNSILVGINKTIMKISEDELEAFLFNADRLKGAVISHTILLERNMDAFLAWYSHRPEKRFGN